MQVARDIRIFIYLLMFSGFLFFSAEVNTIILLLVITLSLLIFGTKININLLKVTFPLFLLFLLGLLSSIGKGNDIYTIIKDIWYFSRPLVFLYCGYLFISDYRLLMRLIIFFGLVSCIAHFITILINYDLLIDYNLDRYRAQTGHSSFLELLSFVIVLFNKEFKVMNSTAVRNTISLILFISLFLYFSRTMLVSFLVFYFIIKGYHKLKLKSIIIWVGTICAIGIGILFLMTHELKQGGFVYKIKNSLKEITMDSGFDSDNEKLSYWRAYEATLAINQYWDKSTYIRLTGMGFGSTVDLKKKYFLGGNKMRYIPHIHNGFVNILFKLGIFGILIYFFFFFRILLVINKKVNYEIQEIRYIQRLILAFVIHYIFTSFIIGGIYNKGDYSIFFLGSFLHIYFHQTRFFSYANINDSSGI